MAKREQKKKLSNQPANKAPEGLWQAFIQMVLDWPPRLRATALIFFGILVAAYSIWSTLPDTAKTDLVARLSPKNQQPGSTTAATPSQSPAANTVSNSLSVTPAVKPAVKDNGYDFDAFGLSWHVWKGKPVNSPNGILLVGPADIQTNKTYQSGNLVVITKAEKWLPDTSVGFEMWDPDRYSIRVDNGMFIVGTPTGDICRKEIPNWSTCRKNTITLEILWNKQNVQLYINKQLIISYNNSDVPTRSLKIRSNATSDDRLTITRLDAG